MKKIRICLEVQGLGQDEYGTPCSNVVCVTLGDDDAEELTGAEYKAFLEQIKIEDVLRLCWLDQQFSPADCRLMMPEEYGLANGEQNGQGNITTGLSPVVMHRKVKHLRRLSPCMFPPQTSGV